MSHLEQGVVDAAALISRAVLDADLLPAVDQVVSGDATRETLAAVAVLAAGLAGAVADLRCEPVDAILDLIAGEAASRVAEGC